MHTKNYDQFVNVSYSGRELLKKHSLDEYGTWNVRGEDPNCDWGGSHHMPNLGTYEGYLKDIITMAVELPNFWTWGGGGDITKTNITKITLDTIKERNEKRERYKHLENEMSILKKELGL